MHPVIHATPQLHASHATNDHHPRSSTVLTLAGSCHVGVPDGASAHVQAPTTLFLLRSLVPGRKDAHRPGALGGSMSTCGTLAESSRVTGLWQMGRVNVFPRQLYGVVLRGGKEREGTPCRVWWNAVDARPLAFGGSVVRVCACALVTGAVINRRSQTRDCTHVPS